MEQLDEEVHRARSGSVGAQEFLSPGNWDAPPFGHVDAFTNIKAPQILFRVFEELNL